MRGTGIVKTNWRSLVATDMESNSSETSEKPEIPFLFEEVSEVKSKDCVVLVYDFEGFTRFLSVPDIQRHISTYLNFIDQQVRKAILGGTFVFGEKQKMTPLAFSILHEKFLGDGVMFLLEYEVKEAAKRDSAIKYLCHRLWNLKNSFAEVNAAAMEFMPVSDVPGRIRIGLTYGPTLELTRSDGAKEYLGFALNLAARLQKYSGQTSFLASARLPRADKWFDRKYFVKVRAKSLRGRDGELVWIEKRDYEKTKKTPDDQNLFEPIAIENTHKKSAG